MDIKDMKDMSTEELEAEYKNMRIKDMKKAKPDKIRADETKV